MKDCKMNDTFPPAQYILGFRATNTIL